MVTQTQQQGFPNVASPFVRTGGYIEQAWLQFLINLWNRTGASQGGSPFSSGDIKESAAAGAQTGWLVCDGSAISRTIYSSLFQTIGTTYGSGDGSTTFNIPDYRGRFKIGTNTTYLLGATGGTETQTLSVPNLPAHNHTVTDPGHIHGVNDPTHHHSVSNGSGSGGTGSGGTGGSTQTTDALTGITIQSATTGITTQNTGSGTAFSILPPYAPVTVLIKV